MSKGSQGTVSLDAIKADYEENARQMASYSDDQFESLKADIAENGVIEPLIVHKIDDPEYKFALIAGFRRYTASKALQDEERRQKPSYNFKVPVRIDDTVTDETREEAVLARQIQNKSFTLAELVYSFGRLQDRGWSIKDIHAKFGYSKSKVSNICALSDAPQELVDILNTNENALRHLAEANKQLQTYPGHRYEKLRENIVAYTLKHHSEPYAKYEEGVKKLVDATLKSASKTSFGLDEFEEFMANEKLAQQEELKALNEQMTNKEGAEEFEESLEFYRLKDEEDIKQLLVQEYMASPNKAKKMLDMMFRVEVENHFSPDDETF